MKKKHNLSETEFYQGKKKSKSLQLLLKRNKDVRQYIVSSAFAWSSTDKYFFYKSQKRDSRIGDTSLSRVDEGDGVGGKGRRERERDRHVLRDVYARVARMETRPSFSGWLNEPLKPSHIDRRESTKKGIVAKTPIRAFLLHHRNNQNRILPPLL